MVAVDGDVQLEVLDWGGPGRPLILLAGGGNTAHVFDELAPKLTAFGHVYGITRRGFGASGFSATDRPLERLRDDVVAVMDALALDRPVLLGHSIAGAELSAIATSYPSRVAGLIYLEAGYPYAFDNGKGPRMEEFQQLQAPRGPTPAESDRASFVALQDWEAKIRGVRIPEAELRQSWDSTFDGRPLKARPFPGSQLFMPILTSTKRYTAIPAPALVVFALPHRPDSWMSQSTDPAVREAAAAYFSAIDVLTERQAKELEAGAPAARVVRSGGAHHLFLSNEGDVVREVGAFLATLKQSSRP
jgi:pimeloyl-ACP methyl ester carboxylesterase